MSPQLYFFASAAFGFIAWGIVANRYFAPRIRDLERPDALRPILILHSILLPLNAIRLAQIQLAKGLRIRPITDD